MDRFLKPPERVINSLSASEKQIYDYMESDLENVVESSIVEISKDTFCSPSTVFNLLKKLGYNGYKEFKFECINYLNGGKTITGCSGDEEQVYDFISGKQMLLETIENQDFNFIKTVAGEIRDASRVLIIANEITRYVAKDFTYRMQLCGVDAICATDHKQYEIFCAMDVFDYVIVFSKFGNTETIIQAFEHANRKLDLLITSNSSCFLSTHANKVLVGRGTNTNIDEHHDALGDISSRVELHIIADMIINTYLYE